MADLLQGQIAPNDFVSLVAELRTAETEKDARVGKLRSIRARMEKQGTDMKALDMALPLLKLDPAEAVQRARNMLRYLEWMQLPLGAQGALFSDDGPRPADGAVAELKRAEAYNEGFQAGIKGRKSGDHRFPAGSPLASAFLTGWEDGQQALAEQLLMTWEKGTHIAPPKREAKAKAGTATAKGNPRGRGAKGRRGNGAESRA